MKEIDPKRMRRREVQRLAAKRVIAKGEARFIWLYGVLGWGGLMFIVMTILEFRHSGSLHGAYLLGFLLFDVVIWIFAGYLFGRRMWKRFERLAGE